MKLNLYSPRQRWSLALVRLRIGITQREIAARLGVTQNRVSRLEGSTDPRLRTLEKYARAIGGELSVFIRSREETFEIVFLGREPECRSESGSQGWMISKARPFRRWRRSCQHHRRSGFFWRSVTRPRTRTRKQWRRLEARFR